MGRLDDLPAELICMIAEHIPKKRDLRNLAAVSRRLNVLVATVLYKDIAIHSRAGRLHDIDLTPFLNNRWMGHARNLALSSKDVFVRNPKWCPSNHATVNQPILYKHVRNGRIVRLTENGLTAILSKFRANSMKSFEWNIGVCVPEAILGTNGFLIQNQSQLQAISLITDPACLHYQNLPMISLKEFRNLKSLSWIGPRCQNDYNQVFSAIVDNAPHFEKLELDCLSSDRSNPLHIGFRNLLHYSPATSSQLFPVIREISLSGVKFEFAPDYERSHTFPFSFGSLQSLILRQCPGWLSFVTQGILASGCLNIQTLDIKTSLFPLDNENNGFHGFEYVLRHCNHLKDLFLLGGTTDLLRLVKAIGSRHKTLERLVLDVSEVSDDQTDGVMDTLSKRPAENPLRLLNLRFLGIPSFELTHTQLVGLLKARDTHSHLEVIHLRQPMDSLQQDEPVRPRDLTSDRLLAVDLEVPWPEIDPDEMKELQMAKVVVSEGLLAFASWAFNTPCLPKLKMVIVGDFQWCAEYKGSKLILVRDQNAHDGYQPLDQRNPAHVQLFKEHQGTVEVCQYHRRAGN